MNQSKRADENNSGPTCSPDCTATGTGITGGMAGVTATFTIQARDEFANMRTTGGDPFRVLLIPGVQRISVKDFENGSYLVSYVAEKGGKYDIAVTLMGINIQGSPFKADFKTQGGQAVTPYRPPVQISKQTSVAKVKLVFFTNSPTETNSSCNFNSKTESQR